jgi:hypothetical protein
MHDIKNSPYIPVKSRDDIEGKPKGAYYHWRYSVKYGLPTDELEDAPVGAAMLTLAHMIAGERYETIKDLTQIEQELTTSIGGFLNDNHPWYYKETDKWTFAVKTAVERTANGTNYIWINRAETITPQRKSLRVVRR